MNKEVQRLVTVMMHIRIGYFEFLIQLFVTICTDERLFTSVYGIIRYNGFIPGNRLYYNVGEVLCFVI